MDCPKCSGKLQKKHMEDIEVDVCYVCEGIWFDAGEMEEVIKKDSKNFEFIDVGKEEFDGKELKGLLSAVDEKTGKCPKCDDGTMMLRDEYGEKNKITVDLCPKGHGLWLDGGEILQLRNRGLVELKDQFDLFLSILKSMFSREGFRAFRQHYFGRKHINKNEYR
jgi:Zn-finger nucleic acid-binding protein